MENRVERTISDVSTQTESKETLIVSKTLDAHIYEKQLKENQKNL